MKKFDEVNKGKAIHEMECLFSNKEIEQTVKEMYPNMEQSEINYHVGHLEEYDCLKVAIDENNLEEAIEEQVGYQREDFD